jgi:hypothetical protein
MTRTDSKINNTTMHVKESHPPIQKISDIAREEFTAMKLTTGRSPDIQTFISDNWMMIIVFIILAVILITYVARGLKK